MKRILVALLVVGAAATALPAAAAPWQNINQRQAQLDQRIDVGVRNGSLTRREATSLRAQFRDLERLEVRYRANGLTPRERIDLDRRFDSLSAQIRSERHDRQAGRDAGNRYR